MTTTPMRRDSPEQIRKAYFFWLCKKVKNDKPQHNKWQFLLSLHEKDFYWSIPNDDNRGEDGKKLRETFVYEMLDEATVPPCLDCMCSILEMLVALAFRMDHMMIDLDRVQRVDKWFWEMIDNLRLEKFEDDDPNADMVIKHNDRKLDSFLLRRITPMGRGGLFPLKHRREDQRTVEIWYQLAAYLDERYPF